MVVTLEVVVEDTHLVEEDTDKKESILDKLFNRGQDKKEEKKKQLEELKEAVSKQASQAGTSTNRDIRIVEDIGRFKPIVDWRYVLRECKNIL